VVYEVVFRQPAHKNARKDLPYRGVLAGLAAGFITDMIVTADGA
jgi:hypothetical protein